MEKYSCEGGNLNDQAITTGQTNLLQSFEKMSPFFYRQTKMFHKN